MSLLFTLLLTLFSTYSFAELDSKDLLLFSQSDDPEHHYQLGEHYLSLTPFSLNKQTDLQPKSITKHVIEGFYWLEKSAKAGWEPAQFRLGMLIFNNHDSLNHSLQGSDISRSSLSYDESLFWLFSSILNNSDSAKRQEALEKVGSFYQSKQNTFTAKLMYRLAFSISNGESDAYTHLLEKEYLSKKKEQIDSFSTFEQKNLQSSEPPIDSTELQDTHPISNVYISIIILFITVVFFVYLIRKKKKRIKSVSNNEEYKIKLHKALTRLKETHSENQSLKQQLTQIQQLDNIKQAYALFGFSSDSPLDKHTLKERFKQLTRIYHPDRHGSHFEMQRLNTALKIIAHHQKIK
ncbi:hypothetical protein N9R79_02975 [Vibrio sp.]|nr:hypothetical protein [Vibrio sp.]